MDSVIALLIAATSIPLAGVWIFGKTTLGRALARRIEGGDRSDNTDDVDALHDEMQRLREQNAEILERLDFTERLLTQARNLTPPAEKVVSGEH